MIVNRKELVEKLTHLVRITSKKEDSNFHHCILFESDQNKLKLTARNREKDLFNSVEIKAKDSKEHSFILPGRIFLNSLKSLSVDLIDLELIEATETLQISDGITTFSIRILDASLFPQQPAIKQQPKTFSVEIKPLLEAFKKILPAAAGTGFLTDCVLTGVNFQLKNNILKIAATDGNRLAYKKIELSKKYKKQISCNIRPSVITEFIKIAEKHQDGKVLINYQENDLLKLITFSFSVYSLRSKTIWGTFPLYEKLIPQNCDSKAVFFTSDLLNCLDRVSIFSNPRTLFVFLQNCGRFFEIKAKNVDNASEAKSTIIAMKNSFKHNCGFNFSFLVDALKTIDTDKVVIQAQTANKEEPEVAPILFSNYGDSSFLYLVMPQTIKNNTREEYEAA